MLSISACSHACIQDFRGRRPQRIRKAKTPNADAPCREARVFLELRLLPLALYSILHLPSHKTMGCPDSGLGELLSP